MAPSPTDLNQRIFLDAPELARELTLNGVECTLTTEDKTSLSSRGDCTIPGRGNDGVDASLTVWRNAGLAINGIVAWTQLQRSLAAITPRTYYGITGANWLIDFGIQGVAAGQVKQALGSGTTIQKVD